METNKNRYKLRAWYGWGADTFYYSSYKAASDCRDSVTRMGGTAILFQWDEAAQDWTVSA